MKNPSHKFEKLLRLESEPFIEISASEAISNISGLLLAKDEYVLAKMKHLVDLKDNVMIRMVLLDGRKILWVYPVSHSMTIYKEYPWYYSIDLKSGEIVDDTEAANVAVQRLKVTRALKDSPNSEEDDELGGGWSIEK